MANRKPQMEIGGVPSKTVDKPQAASTGSGSAVKPDNPYQEGASTNARSKKGSLPGWAKEEMAKRKVLDMCFAYHTEGHCKFGPKCKYLHDTAYEKLWHGFMRQRSPTIMMQRCQNRHCITRSTSSISPYFTKYGHCRHGGKCRWKHEPVREVLGALIWNTLHACCPKTSAVLPTITGMVLDLPYHEIGEILWNNATRDRVTEEALQLLEESRVELRMLHALEPPDAVDARERQGFESSSMGKRTDRSRTGPGVLAEQLLTEFGSKDPEDPVGRMCSASPGPGEEV